MSSFRQSTKTRGSSSSSGLVLGSPTSSGFMLGSPSSSGLVLGSPGSSGLVLNGAPISPPVSPGSYNMDEYGMWIIGDQLFIGYGTYGTVEDIITLCRQTAQYIHVCPSLSNTEALLKFVKILNTRLTNIRTGSLAITRELGNKRLRELLHRYLQRMAEITPLLISSIEAFVIAGTDAGKNHASQNRDCFKQQLLETIRDFVILLQLLKNNKPVPAPPSLKGDPMERAQEWLGGNASILSNTGMFPDQNSYLYILTKEQGFDSIRICLCDGRKLASQLNVGIDKGELMAVCSEAELTASQLRKLYMKGMGSGAEAGILSLDLSRQLSHLKDRMVEALSRKTLDDFMERSEPILALEKAALIAHFKPQRDVTFMERRFRFEEYNNNLISDIETACELRMIPSADKVEAVKHTADVLSGLGPQVVWAAKLLFTNPYSEILRDHFDHLKQAWLRKAEQLRALFMTCADLRTYPRHKDTRSYVSRSSVSPAKQVNFVSSVRLEPKEPTPPPAPPKIPIPREQPTWESADKDLIQAARKLAMIMCRLVYLVRNDGCTRMELLNSSKDIVRACDIVSRLTKELAKDCSDKQNQSLLMKFCERIPTFATQLKMVCTVKAATIGSQTGCEEDEQATEMLLENARNLMSSVRETLDTAAAASINIRVAAAQYTW